MIDKLFWKDLRNQRPVILVALLLLIGPYVVAVGMSGLPYSNSEPDRDAIHAFNAFSCLSIAISQISILIMGATIIGSEKQDGGLEFLLTMPPKRWKILIAKVMYSAIVFIVVWSVFFLAQFLIADEFGSQQMLQVQGFGVGAAATGILFFGVAWLTSVVVRGAAIPICSSLVTATLLLLIVRQVGVYRDWQFDVFHVYYCRLLFTSFILLGATAFVLGCVVFCRRYAP